MILSKISSIPSLFLADAGITGLHKRFSSFLKSTDIPFSTASSHIFNTTKIGISNSNN
jgi:hypothetical protein